MKEEILKLHAQGWTYSAIADRIGCSKSTVCFHVGEGQKTKYYRRNSRNRRRNRDDLKIAHGGKCKNCGYDRCLAALTFYHRDPSQKSFIISTMAKGKESLIEEANKCDLLCANCHFELHNCPNLKG